MTRSIKINDQLIDIWPNDLKVDVVNKSPPMFRTVFNDYPQYHQSLIDTVFELENDDNFRHRMDIGGSKVRNIESWGTPEANLIHARAIEFFSIAVDKKPSEVKLDVCWASISRKYEYLSPHSHTHSIGSVVYSLLPGEKVPDKYLDGLLCFLDPRIPDCCPVEDEAATKEIAPNMEQGAMVIFPSNLIHYVHPYTGDTPRITLAWNFYL